jgi:peptide/nickel transport system permease protein
MMPSSWTDYSFIGLVLLMIIGTGFSLREAPTRRAFKRLLMNPFAVSAGVLLLVFFAIACLDCLHGADDRLDERNTVLDYMLSPLGEVYEKTFSAPLSLISYTTETRLQDGRVTTLRPRLRYSAPFFKNNQQRNQFVQTQLGWALFAGGSAGLFFLGLALGFRHLFGRQSWGEWRNAVYACCLSTAFVVCVGVALYALSRELHVLGTGKIGQDIFYYAVKSIRTGLVIGVLTTLFTLPFALLLGVAAGYFGGVVDDIIQYVYTTLSSIPGVLLITASVLSMQTFIVNHPAWFVTLAQQADARLMALCVILGVTSWTSLCRLLRAEALKLKHIDYVIAAHVLGVSAYRILRTHLLPNVMHIVMITLVLDFSYLILAEALLTYVGVGVSPMTISWGNMINSARLELARDPMVWWPMGAAFVFMFMLVLASNVFADALEEAWNPRSAV